MKSGLVGCRLCRGCVRTPMRSVRTPGSYTCISYSKGVVFEERINTRLLFFVAVVRCCCLVLGLFSLSICRLLYVFEKRAV